MKARMYFNESDHVAKYATLLLRFLNSKVLYYSFRRIIYTLKQINTQP